MTISFIVTTYNIRTYIEQCLDSLFDVVQPGDQIILVDDGSTDGTDDLVRSLFAAPDRDLAGVELTPVFLGQNTVGGVGIAGNIGVDHATRDTVFFVDGDDWLDVAGFNRARMTFESGNHDILITNYQEFDEKNRRYKAPADHAKWGKLRSNFTEEARRLFALNLIAVPWRKFYRRAFLIENEITYPEGDFFFEDNPYHWEVCLTADRIGFCDEVLCYHRVNRPGQTMSSSGSQLAAFFTHFQTIQGLLKDKPEVFMLQSLAWLIGNMAWHIGRLNTPAAAAYFRKGQAAFASLPDGILDHPKLAPWFEREVGPYVSVLSEATWVEAFQIFQSRRLAQDVAKLNKQRDTQHDKQFDMLRKQIDAMRKHISDDMRHTRSHATAVSNALTYQAMRRNYFARKTLLDSTSEQQEGEKQHDAS